MDLALRLAHLMSSAVWFGGMVVTAADVRRLRRQLILSLLSGLIAVSTGAATIFLHGGFAAHSRRFHLAFGLSLMALLAEVQVLAPTLRVLETDATAPKRFAVATYVVHALRTVVFALMVVRA